MKMPGERFLASARNDNVCHLERSERSFSSPIFEGGHEEHEVKKFLKHHVLPLRRLRALGGEMEFERCSTIWELVAQTICVRRE